MVRLLEAEYSDTESLPRGGLQFSSLPSPRAVSLAVHQELEQASNHDDISVMVMQWGQFLDHDLSLTPGTLNYLEDTDHGSFFLCYSPIKAML